MADFTSIYHRKCYPAIDPLAPQNSQKGRTVLITGSTSGIGFATAEAYLQANSACIVILGRSDATLGAAIARLEAKRPTGSTTRFVCQKCDIGDTKSIQDLWAALKIGKVEVDVLILNAAVTGRISELHEAWAFFEQNVRSGLNMAEEFLKQGPSEGKVLLAVSSARAHLNRPELEAYGPSKTAAASMFQAMASYYKPEQLCILNVVPGAVLTDGARRAGYDETTIPWDNANLPASYMVWAATKQATFLHGRFVWVHWDVDEMMGMKARFEKEPGLLKIGLQGIEPVDLEGLFARISKGEIGN